MNKEIQIHYNDYTGIIKLTNCEEQGDIIHLNITSEKILDKIINGLIELKKK